MPRQFALGLDFGTNSCRALFVDLDHGVSAGDAMAPYPSGDLGVYHDPNNVHVARQNPHDYVHSLMAAVQAARHQLVAKEPNFRTDWVVGIGVDTTGSTVLPVDRKLRPMSWQDSFADDLDAMAWLWKDHSAHEEADEITRVAQQRQPELLQNIGGAYSSEWFWAKILRLQRTNPTLFHATHNFVELCDWIPALLADVTDPRALQRGICAAGHKAMFDHRWGGMPPANFWQTIQPELARIRDRMGSSAVTADHVAGTLSHEWAEKLGLPQGIPIAVGALDAHMGAVGAGIQPGRMVKILGTSTCDLLVAASDKAPNISGICGAVQGSVLPGCTGLEAGQAAVGDIFLSWVRHHVPASYGTTVDEKFVMLEREAGLLRPGQHGLLGLDWHNGNRNVLANPLLSGLLVGWSLQTTAAEVYRALLEATAFGALKIIERFTENGIAIDEVVCCGGLANQNPLLLQIYADVTNRPMFTSAVEQTCALGAAIFAGAAAGVAEVGELQRRLCRLQKTAVTPNPVAHQSYQRLYGLYCRLHDTFGLAQGPLGGFMQELQEIRGQAGRTQ